MSTLDFDLVQSVIEHMNEDHRAAVLVYVQAYAGRVTAESAHIVALDSEGMQISCQEAGQSSEVRVPFIRPLANAAGLRTELVRMAKEGRERLVNNL